MQKGQHRVIEFREGVGMWNPMHSLMLHVGFVTRINVTFGSGMHKGTQKCQLCRHKTGDKSNDMIDHGDKIGNEMVTMINGRRERQSIRRDRFRVADLVLTI